MTISEVKELLSAGFTHDEIMSMITPATPDKTPETTPDKTPETNPETTPDKTPETTPEKTDVEKQIESLTNLVGGLVKAVQASNIINSCIDSFPGDDPGAVDKIFASIIRPERKV